jgi:hypothetical protein
MELQIVVADVTQKKLFTGKRDGDIQVYFVESRGIGFNFLAVASETIQAI